MKSSISDPERAFILEGFRLNTCRRDGRGLLDYRNFKLQLGAVPHGFGSSQLVFGEEETQIICSIKAELQKPLPSQPRNG
jgi:exosome complex RNA-binding protein Rrp42 (RNase PH superfamily)